MLGCCQCVRKEKGDGYLVSTNFNLATKSGHYPCWRYDTAAKMLGDVRYEHNLTTDYITSVLDAIHVEGMWVDTAISYIFDLKNGDIYVYFFHEFGDAARMNFEEEMTEINESSQLSASVFSAPLNNDVSTSRTYFFHQLYSEETIEKARSEVEKYKRQYYFCIAVGVVVAGTVILLGSLFIYRKMKKRWKKKSLHEDSK